MKKKYYNEWGRYKHRDMTFSSKTLEEWQDVLGVGLNTIVTRINKGILYEVIDEDGELTNHPPVKEDGG